MLRDDSGRVSVLDILALWEGCCCQRELLKFLLNGCYKPFKYEFSAFFFFFFWYSIHLSNFTSLMGGTPVHKTLGRLLPPLKAWKQEGNFGLCLQTSPNASCRWVCCMLSAPMFTFGRDVGWGRKRAVRPVVSMGSGWHPPRAISHPWHVPGKGLRIPLYPDSLCPCGAVLVCCRPSFGK